MKHLTFLIFCFLLHYAASVRNCYQCDDCEKNPTLNNVTCKDVIGEGKHYLCQDKKVEGVITRGCMENEQSLIRDCDYFNEDNDTSTYCFHCDREYCNSRAEISSGSVFVVSILTYLLSKLL